MKWYGYLICIILIFVGGLAGIDLWQQWTAESYVRGTINVENVFRVESFGFVQTSGITLYRDIYENANEYRYVRELARFRGFAGQGFLYP